MSLKIRQKPVKEVKDVVPDNKNWSQEYEIDEKEIEALIDRRIKANTPKTEARSETQAEVHYFQPYERYCPDGNCKAENPNWKPSNYECSTCHGPLGNYESDDKFKSSIARCPFCGATSGRKRSK
jgi:hypothetical protein